RRTQQTLIARPIALRRNPATSPGTDHSHTMPMVLAVCPGLVALSAAAWGQAGGLAAGTCADAIDLGQGGTGPRPQQRAGIDTCQRLRFRRPGSRQFDSDARGTTGPLAGGAQERPPLRHLLNHKECFMRVIIPVLALSFAAATAAYAVPAPSPSDFVSDAIKGDNSEIQMGKLAQDQGHSAAIRSFGRLLVSDHSKAKDQMNQVAQKVGVTPPTATSADADAEMQKLKGMKGADFDNEFASF